jgi:hypothetical protein
MDSSKERPLERIFLITLGVSFAGLFCPGISHAVKSMNKEEVAVLTVRPECTQRFPCQ